MTKTAAQSAQEPQDWRVLEGWGAVESGLDLVFKATLVRLWLYLMAGFSELMSPRAGELFDGVFTALGFMATSVLVIGLSRLREVSHGTGARRLAGYAAWAGWCQLGLEFVRVLIFLGIVGDDDADSALALTARLCAVGALLLAATAAARIGAFIGDAGAFRQLVLGRNGLILVAAGLVVIAMVVPGAERTTQLVLYTGQMVIAVGALVMILTPLHKLGLRLRTVGSPTLADATTHAAGEAPTDDDADEADWVPRAHRPAPALSSQPASALRHWRTGHGGLQLLFRVLVARAVLSLSWVAFGEPLVDTIGEGTATVAFVAIEATSVLLLLAYWRIVSLPTATGVRPALGLAALMTLALLVVEIIWFGGWGPTGEVWRHVGTLLRYQAFQLLILLVVLRGLWRLGAHTDSQVLRRRSFLAGYLMTMTVVAMVGLSLFVTLDDSELNLLKATARLVVLAMAGATVIATLQAVHEAIEEADDACDRLRVG